MLLQLWWRHSKKQKAMWSYGHYSTPAMEDSASFHQCSPNEYMLLTVVVVLCGGVWYVAAILLQHSERWRTYNIASCRGIKGVLKYMDPFSMSYELSFHNTLRCQVRFGLVGMWLSWQM